ncbi:hypothetical protein QVD17_39088 [Tagetes erecta]|uniref:Uncharacterized protein n=1 Tax=Tagetes erecta TaxID=13708 RepID=A0AAD8JRN9_TARER|nr:hypothetical protein QVD17_39088 [Tagetes erecta]
MSSSNSNAEEPKQLEHNQVAFQKNKKNITKLTLNKVFSRKLYFKTETKLGFTSLHLNFHSPPVFNCHRLINSI